MSEREKLFIEWRLLSVRIEMLGNIIQNPIDDLSYQTFAEHQNAQFELKLEFDKLQSDTWRYIYNEKSREWAENGEFN